VRDDGDMALTLITGPANAGKARVVLDAVRQHAARGGEPLLVVPTHADVERYLRELVEDAGAVFGVRVLSFDGLVSEIARRAGFPQRPLGALACERVARVVAEQTPLQAMRAAAATGGFARALTHLAGELEAQRVQPPRLIAALRGWEPPETARGAYAQELGALYRGYRKALERAGRDDPEMYAVRALDALRGEPSRWAATPVFFYGFDDLTTVQLDVIETLAVVVDAPVSLSLAYEAGRAAFAGRATTFQTLAPRAVEHVALAAREQYYAPRAREALHHLERSLFEQQVVRVDPGDAVALLEGGGERAEFELVAGEVRALLDQGVPAGEVAIVMRTLKDSSALLAEVLIGFQIPFSLERRVRFGDTASGRALLGLLRSALLEGSIADLLAWLRAPGLLERPELADALEARARAHGASSAAAARTLWEEQHWPLNALDRVSAAPQRGAGPLLACAARELARLFCAPYRRLAPRLSAPERDEARALAAARRALGELDELARAAPGMACDARALVAALEGLELVSGDPAGPDAVVVADALALRARRVRALFLCGMQEGRFPAPARSEPFLADEDRRALAEASGLRLGYREDGLGAERYLLYATLSRAQERLFLSWHTADDDGAPALASIFVDDVCDLFSQRLRSGRRRRELGAADWPGPGLPTASALPREAARTGPRLRPRGIAALSDERVLADLRQAPWSASGLGTWAGCSVRWFVERLLRVDDLEPEPEPLVRGSLAHAVLEATLRGLIEQTGSARLTGEGLALALRIMRSELQERAPDSPLSVHPERRPGALRRLEVDLERFLVHSARGSAGLQTRALELSFGFAEDEYPALELGDGIRVRGRIDRIDCDPQGRAVVYDYKGRSAPEPGKWVSDHHFQVALYMHATEQLLGLTPVGGFYQPLGARDLRARGLLDADSAIELDYVNGDRRDHEQVQDLLAETVAAARSTAARARSGELHAHPESCAYGGGCKYPTICRCES
jgi:ATP-dependent helicase/DNAse subunit B